ncbi:hypothetical protein GCM10009847_07720 [Leucobacter tardus]
MPDIAPVLEIDAEQEVAADERALAAITSEAADPTAVGFLHGESVWASDGAPIGIASLTKLVTALVGLERRPLQTGESGPTYTVTAADDAVRERVLAENGVVADAPAGLELTERQMLELVLMPSANNYAILYAEWVFGSEAAFADAASAWAEREGLESLRVIEPTGLSPENTATAADLVRLGSLALEHPVIAEIVHQSWVDIPGIGPIENSNPILGEEGVIGVKTGTSTFAGFHLLAARTAVVDGRPVTAISAVLGRTGDEARAADSRAVLDAALATARMTELLAPETVVGSAVAWDGSEVPLIADGGAAAVLVPGEVAHLSSAVGAVSAGDAGSVVGAVTVATPSGTEQVRVVTGAAITEPSFWWRFGHPAIVFGWADPGA